MEKLYKYSSSSKSFQDSVGIISYGCGNIRSVINAVNFCGWKANLIETPDAMFDHEKIILPGVGAFDQAINRLEEKDLISSLLDWTADNSKKLLGICLGMQLLCEHSEESKNNKQGLGLIKGNVRLLKDETEKKLPNIGWCSVDFNQNNYKQYNGDYYFLHSYGVSCSTENTLATAFYGGTQFVCGISNGDNILGYQFHPEKSHKKGLELIREFCLS